MKSFCYFILLLLLIYCVFMCNCAPNNVCPTYEDYYTIKDNPRCWYDIAAEGNATDIISSYGYPLEVYKVTTTDGYILTLFRIPNINSITKKGPVYLQHGILVSGTYFIAPGKNSLAFVLADAGYDVWIGNYRGTLYSEGHISLTVHDKKYWDHSIDEIGMYDMQAMLNFVYTKTGQKIIYIGHSLGTTTGLVYGSTFPEQAKQIVKLFVMLAPAASLANMISPARLVAPFGATILDIIKSLGLIRVLSQGEHQNHIFKLYCLESPVFMEFCVNATNLFFGPYSQLKPNKIPVLFHNFPVGTSAQVVRHGGELINIDFRKYNYGINNFAKYGSILPPLYDVSKIETPVFIMYAVNDWACTKTDALNLYKSLSPKAKIYGKYEIGVKNFNHNDFSFGENVRSIVYEPLLRLLAQIP